VPVSLVDELQIEASSTSASVANLLRRVLVVAAKLELSDTPARIRNELSSYKGDKTVPTYRIVHGDIGVPLATAELKLNPTSACPPDKRCRITPSAFVAANMPKTYLRRATDQKN
jgi:hypothetical protein